MELRVHPTLIPARRLIANVEGAMNAILVQGDAVGATLYYGTGGAEPTASAVIADLVDVTRMHTADPEAPRAASRVPARPAVGRAILPMDEVATCYYLRMRVVDKPGRAGRHYPHPRRRAAFPSTPWCRRSPAEGEDQTDIIIAHPPDARETHQRRDRRESRTLPVVTGKVTRIRLEELRRRLAGCVTSTRGGMAPQIFTEILLGGLCPDGGLAIGGEHYPH